MDSPTTSPTHKPVPTPRGLAGKRWPLDLRQAEDKDRPSVHGRWPRQGRSRGGRPPAPMADGRACASGPGTATPARTAPGAGQGLHGTVMARPPSTAGQAQRRGRRGAGGLRWAWGRPPWRVSTRSFQMQPSRPHSAKEQTEQCLAVQCDHQQEPRCPAQTSGQT